VAYYQHWLLVNRRLPVECRSHGGFWRFPASQSGSLSPYGTSN
jgi:hypothetical protein